MSKEIGDPNKVAMLDYSHIMSKEWEAPDKLFAETKLAFKELNKFYLKKSPDPKITYQYDFDNQLDFIEKQERVSGNLETIFPVVREINEIFSTGMSDMNMQVADLESKFPKTQSQPNINVNLGKGGLGDAVKGFFRRGEQLPKSLEDAWTLTRNWQLTNLNIPNLYGKILNFHYCGVLRHSLFGGLGMDYYRNIEFWYTGSIVEPHVMRLIKRGTTLERRNSINIISEANKVATNANMQAEQLKAFGASQAG